MRPDRGSKRRFAVAGVVALAALTLVFVVQTAAAKPAAAACGAGQLSGKVRQSSGAAGTIALSIAVRNTSASACSLRGYPRLKLRNASGPLPTNVRHGGLSILIRPVTTVTLAPGKAGSLLLAYSDVPTGNETHCKNATSLVIILGHGHGRFTIPFAGAPCNHGRLWESPFLAGLHNV
jgi:hypothetical protein